MQLTAQTHLDDIRSGKLNALIDFRYFICEKYRMVLLQKAPTNEYLSDEDMRILPADFENDLIVFELLRDTDLNDQDLARLVYLDAQQEYNKREYGLRLLSLQEMTIRHLTVMAIYVASLRNVNLTPNMTRKELDNVKTYANTTSIKNLIEEKNNWHYECLETLPTDVAGEDHRVVSAYLCSQYCSQGIKITVDYMQSILSKAYQHDKVSEAELYLQANSYANIFSCIDQIKQQARVSFDKTDTTHYAKLTHIADFLEKNLIEYSVLTYSEKITHKKLLKECITLLQPNWNNTVIANLMYTIHRFLNRIIYNLNKKSGYSFSMFTINHYKVIHEELLQLTVSDNEAIHLSMSNNL